MSSPSLYSVQIKTIAVVLFAITAITYFVLTNMYSLSLFGEIFVKCAPVLCLMWFVLLHETKDSQKKNNCGKILFGLTFSCIGDIFLVFDNMFALGMLSFAFAQLFYILALGFNEAKPIPGLVVYMLCISITPLILPATNPVLQCGIPFYSFLLCTMGWRALAKMYHEGTTNWIRVLVATGGVLWMISDTALAYNQFVTSLPYAQVIVMSTYYAGQFGIASVVMLEVPS